MIAGTAESNRSPFDLPEGESEIIAGYYTEYSGFKFALFFLGEYLGLFAVSGLGITLFLGGWHAPVAWLGWVPSWAWFFAKLLALIAVFIWVRGTLGLDQLMDWPEIHADDAGEYFSRGVALYAAGCPLERLRHSRGRSVLHNAPGSWRAGTKLLKTDLSIPPLTFLSQCLAFAPHRRVDLGSAVAAMPA
jgi:hypothetical protein